MWSLKIFLPTCSLRKSKCGELKKRLKWIRTCNYIVSVFAVFSILTLCLVVLMKQPGRSWSTDKSENWPLPLKRKSLCLLLLLKTHTHLYQMIFQSLNFAFRTKAGLLVWYWCKHGLVFPCLSSFIPSLPSHSVLQASSFRALAVCAVVAIVPLLGMSVSPISSAWLTPAHCLDFSLIVLVSWKLFPWFQKARFDLSLYFCAYSFMTDSLCLFFLICSLPAGLYPGRFTVWIMSMGVCDFRLQIGCSQCGHG